MGNKFLICNKDYIIHVLNNLSEEYNMILSELESHLTSSKDDALTIDAFCEKLN